MDTGRALSLLDNMLWTSMVIAGPILLTILAVGLLISLIQVTTQLQEMTLSYVPKMIAAAALLMLLGPWMLSRLMQFAISLYSNIPYIALN